MQFTFFCAFLRVFLCFYSYNVCVYVSLWDTPSKQTALYTFQHTLAVHIKDQARIVTQASSDFRCKQERKAL